MAIMISVILLVISVSRTINAQTPESESVGIRPIPIFPFIPSSPCSCTEVTKLWRLCYQLLCPNYYRDYSLERIQPVPPRDDIIHPIYFFCDRKRVWGCVYDLCSYLDRSPNVGIDSFNSVDDFPEEVLADLEEN
ncbi:UNVERIFIED_CONTAM: hypothetical protein RMT77_019172 [Armadillidium vulgare]